MKKGFDEAGESNLSAKQSLKLNARQAIPLPFRSFQSRSFRSDRFLSIFVIPGLTRNPAVPPGAKKPGLNENETFYMKFHTRIFSSRYAPGCRSKIPCPAGIKSGMT